MEKQEMIALINNSKDESTHKPSFLVHTIGGQHIDTSKIESVKAHGLQADYGDWDDVSQLIPNRPKGNFFWGEDKAQEGNEAQLRVDISDIDTSKLWAFPSMAAWAADELTKGRESMPGLAEALAEIQPVSYSDYNGEFHAEWIYTDDISADVLK